MRIKRLGAATALTLAITCTGLVATSNAGTAAEYVKPIRVSVSYQLPLHGAADNLEDRIKLLEQGRKTIYGMASRECRYLLTEIAETCALKSLNVRNALHSRRHMSAITMTGSANYEITLKSTD